MLDKLKRVDWQGWHALGVLVKSILAVVWPWFLWDRKNVICSVHIHMKPTATRISIIRTGSLLISTCLCATLVVIAVSYTQQKKLWRVMEYLTTIHIMMNPLLATAYEQDSWFPKLCNYTWEINSLMHNLVSTFIMESHSHACSAICRKDSWYQWCIVIYMEWAILEMY